MQSIMAMLRPRGPDAASLYDALVSEARAPGWYLDGGVTDTIDGRFRVLATVVALAILRLETGGEAAARHSVALTESFVTDMDAQLRQGGFGDPTVGKKVRQMVGSLASRVERWRTLLAEDCEWDEAVATSIYAEDAVSSEAATTYARESLRRLYEGLGGASDEAVIAGRWK